MFRIIMPRFIFRIERWKWNKEYRIYVSNMGHFMDEHKKIIPVKINQSGYVFIKTPYGYNYSHRLVMKTWRPTAAMDKLTVDHLDHNKRNNSVENLEWVTRAENLKRAHEDYIDENAKPKTKTVKAIKSGAETIEAAKVMTALKLNPKKDFELEEFYPVINGIAFDDCQTAWWYCQEILKGCHKNQCTQDGLEDRFQRLLEIYNRHHWEYINGKKQYRYCTMTLSFMLKDDNIA